MSASETASSSDTLPKVSMYVLAGEASGDVIGADLIKKMRTKSELNVSGVGGVHMSSAGLKSQFPITDLSVMGYVDVIIRLPRLLLRVAQVVRKIIKLRPNVVVLIDSQVFSNLVAKGLKKRGFPAPIILYVSPTIWGYKPERAQHIKAFYDEVLAILPFEPKVMRDLHGPPCRYVGHPAIQNLTPPSNTSLKNNIVLMPGSRVGELRRHLPMLKTAVQRLAAHNPNLVFTLLTLPHLLDKLRMEVATWSVDVTLEADRTAREKIFSTSKLAIIIAGTATLELAASGVPMVVSYIMDMGQLRIRKKIDLKFFALPNIILDEKLVPELLFEKPDPDFLQETVQSLLDSPKEQENQLLGFERMRKKMANGTNEFPREDAATVVLSHLEN